MLGLTSYVYMPREIQNVASHQVLYKYIALCEGYTQKITSEVIDCRQFGTHDDVRDNKRTGSYQTRGDGFAFARTPTHDIQCGRTTRGVERLRVNARVRVTHTDEPQA
jgi:hypothetical protein